MAWNEELDICGDAIYLQLTGLTAEDLFPALRAETRVGL